MSKVVKLFLAIILIFTIIETAPHTYAKGEETVVDTPSLHVRSGPGLTYSVIGSLKKGDRVDVVAKKADWLQVKIDGKIGWIASWLTKSDKKNEQTNTIIVSKVNQLNIRSGPSTGSAVVGRMQAGDEGVQIDTDGLWVSISFNGLIGWVHSDYINPSASLKVQNDKENEVTDQAFTVSVDALNVRKNADLQSKKIGLVHKGESYPVKQIDGNWLQLSISDKKEGWVYVFHGTLSSTLSNNSKVESKQTNNFPKSVTVLSEGTNIRKEATTSSEIVLRANAGEKFTVVNKSGDWYEITLPNGQSAFIANWVISTDDIAPQKKQPKQKKTARVPGTLKGLTIVVDPGHGGNDRGTTGSSGTDEKDITLLTAELLASKLKAAGANVVVTRESDNYIPLRKRVSISHQAAADAFISIHYDSNPDQSVTGFTTFYTHSHQKALASKINKGLESSITLRNRGTQPADYLVLRENKQNAVLIELGFLSNPNEERTMTTKMFREQAAHGIYKGLLNYFDTTK